MKMKEKRAAILTVFDAPNMTKRGRKQIAAWSREQAERARQAVYGALSLQVRPA